MPKMRMPVLLLLLVSASLHAATIEVRVDRGAYTGPLTLHLGRPADQHEPEWITSREVLSEPVRFEQLQPGQYVVALQGLQPTEHLTQTMNIGEDDERALRLTVPRRRLIGRVTMGGRPVGNVTITLKNDKWNWVGRLIADAAGNVSAPLWDEGDYVIEVRNGNLTAPVKVLANLSGGLEAKLDLALSDRHLRGRVVDDRGKPVAKATVILRVERNGLRSPVAVLTDQDGTFDYPAIEPGRQTMRINADGYLAVGDLTFDVTATDSVIERTVVLVSGATRELKIVDTDDKPVRGAIVVAATGGVVRALATTADDGRVKIATPKDSSCVLWVVPMEGSFAAYRLERDARDVTQIVIPRPTGSLDVRALLGDGTPLPNVSFVLRYNGELAPVALGTMLHRAGNDVSTNADGVAKLERIPPGTYEMWPYATEREAEELIAAASAARAPVSVTVTAGRQTAIVRFEKQN